MAGEIIKAKATGQLQQSKPLSLTSRLALALGAMAMSRGADPNPKVLEIYAEKFSRLPMDESHEADIFAVINEYGDAPQLDHEKAFPDYGTLLLLIQERSHPFRHLRELVRKLARNYGAVPDAAMFELFEQAAGHRTDEDLDKGYLDILKFAETHRMPTAQQFLRACGIPRVYRNGTKPE